MNQRLAPGVYLGVVPVKLDAAGNLVAVGPAAAAEPHEWAVAMRRLDPTTRADFLLAHGQLEIPRLRELATKLADFHAKARGDAETGRWGELAVLQHHVAENFAQSRQTLAATLDPGQAADLEREQTGFLASHAALFSQRIAEGRVRDGHGDLRLEHVYFEGEQVLVVDCIEFNDQYRFADVAADIAFLAMDLTVQRRPDLAEIFLAAYARASDDYGLYQLIDFYESYRAHVRAKIAGFLAAAALDTASRERALQDARRYFLLALAAERRQLQEPTLILVGGGLASGKSTLADHLGQQLACPVLEADYLRKKLLGHAPTTRLWHAPFTGAYSPENTRHVYQELRQRAELILRSGRCVVIDASFRRREERALFRELAESLGLPWRFLLCTADPTLCRARLRERERHPSTSDGRLALYDTFMATWENHDDLPPSQVLTLDTGQTLETNLDHLRRLLPILPPQLG